jgi:hypothetical protein
MIGNSRVRVQPPPPPVKKKRKFSAVNDRPMKAGDWCHD